MEPLLGCNPRGYADVVSLSSRVFWLAGSLASVSGEFDSNDSGNDGDHKAYPIKSYNLPRKLSTACDALVRLPEQLPWESSQTREQRAPDTARCKSENGA